MTIHGIRYKNGAVIRLIDKDIGYYYGVIIHMLLIEEQKIFITKKMETKGFNKQFCAFEVVWTAIVEAVMYEHILSRDFTS